MASRTHQFSPWTSHQGLLKDVIQDVRSIDPRDLRYILVPEGLLDKDSQRGEIIAPPGMLGTWAGEWNSWYQDTPGSAKSGMVLIVAHGDLSHTGAKFEKYSSLLTGNVVARPVVSAPGISYRRDNPALKEMAPDTLASSLGAEWRKGTPKPGSSQSFMVTSYQSWKGQVLAKAPKCLTYQYSSTLKAHKLDRESITVVTPALVVKAISRLLLLWWKDFR
ncbi:MAG: hypothetical protein Q9196_007000 [Gyalolechia fulgens]